MLKRIKTKCLQKTICTNVENPLLSQIPLVLFTFLLAKEKEEEKKQRKTTTEKTHTRSKKRKRKKAVIGRVKK